MAGDGFTFLGQPTGTTSGTVATGDHHHAGADVDSGTVAFARLPTGTTGSTVAVGNHGHAGADITSGTVAYARLPVGTAASTVTAGNDSRLVALNSDRLTVGEFVPQRDRLSTSSVASASGTLSLAYFTADKTETITTLSVSTGGTAAAATPTLCRMGIYSVAGNGNLTLEASTANDTTLFSATSTIYPKALSSSLSKVAGQRYATALLVVSGTTTPTFVGLQLVGNNSLITWTRLDPIICGRVTGQTDLPSSVTFASVAGGQAMIGMLLS